MTIFRELQFFMSFKNVGFLWIEFKEAKFEEAQFSEVHPFQRTILSKKGKTTLIIIIREILD